MESDSYFNKPTQKFCRYGCGQLVTFDFNIKSKNGILIPLDSANKTPHQCPNKPTFQSAYELQNKLTKSAKHVISETQAVDFAQWLVDILNSNVCKNFKLRLVIDKEET